MARVHCWLAAAAAAAAVAPIAADRGASHLDRLGDSREKNVADLAKEDVFS